MTTEDYQRIIEHLIMYADWCPDISEKWCREHNYCSDCKCDYLREQFGYTVKKTYCTFYQSCIKGKTCPQAATPEAKYSWEQTHTTPFLLECTCEEPDCLEMRKDANG